MFGWPIPWAWRCKSGPGAEFGREGLRGLTCGASHQEYPAFHRQTMRVGVKREAEPGRGERR